MRLSRAHLVPVLAVVAGGVIGASLSFGLLGRSPADDVPAPEQPVPEQPAPERPRTPVMSVVDIDECADNLAVRLLDWVDKCADVRGDGFDEEPDLSAAPVFTPMTVRPEIRNGSEVQQALMRLYPPILRDAGIGGTVVIWFFISEEGRVLDRRVFESSGRQQLDEAALQVADVFRFSPALNREQIVQVWIQLPITFEVQN